MRQLFQFFGLMLLLSVSSCSKQDNLDPVSLGGSSTVATSERGGEGGSEGGDCGCEFKVNSISSSNGHNSYRFTGGSNQMNANYYISNCLFIENLALNTWYPLKLEGDGCYRLTYQFMEECTNPLVVASSSVSIRCKNTPFPSPSITTTLTTAGTFNGAAVFDFCKNKDCTLSIPINE